MGEACFSFCLPPFPVVNEMCTIDTGALPLASSCREHGVISVVTRFCCRVTGTVGDIYDKETSFSLLPADLPTM